ncbi:MAG TPA: ABC transporter permease [Bryobacteraceae bacterium]|jgi:ABC-2 type transport system permease protein|nr:ABC transporter permease [Bryobacteraceae bacterium]
MTKLILRFFNYRVLALVKKEFGQIRRDRRLALSMIVPPTLQVLLFGYALNATVSNVRLGVLDDSHTPESRELIATLSESRSFTLANTYISLAKLSDAISKGQVQAGAIIPYDLARKIQRGRTAEVQFLLNAMDANTATIAQAYAEGVLATYNANLAASGVHAQFTRIAAPDISRRGQVQLSPAFLYNPGLVSSWFIVSGIFGLLCILNGSLVSSAAMVKERERGTLEQLLMSPAGTSEIIIAKMTPLFILLCLMALFATFLMKAVFHVPFQGSFMLLFGGAALCVLSGIGIGTVIATFTKSAEQAQLTSFFVNPPLASLSGALTPVEAMPHGMQPLTQVNPIYHFSVIARGVMLKGSGLDTLWPNFLALALFTLILVSLSVWRFRKQLG